MVPSGSFTGVTSTGSQSIGTSAALKILKEKKESMEKGLEEAFTGTKASWSSPLGGCYTWFEMTDGTHFETRSTWGSEGDILKLEIE